MSTRSVLAGCFGHSVQARRRRRPGVGVWPAVELLEARQLLTAAAGRDELVAALAVGPLDLAGVEALKKKPKPPPKPNITAVVTAGPNASGLVTVGGKTYDKAKVTLEIVATGKTQPLVKASAKGVYSISLTVGFGSTQVKLTATAPGKKATSTTLTVNRPDTVPPVLTLGALSQGPLTGIQETITGNVSDPIAGVKSLTAVLDGQSSAVSVDAAGNFSYTTSLPLNGSADGAHTLQFVAADGAGNTTSSAVENFTLDTRAPTITVSSPQSNSLETSNFDISGQVKVEQGAGPASLTAALDNGTPQPVSLLSDGSFEFPTTLKTDGSNDGPNTYTLVATDQAGNTSAPTVFPFTLETRGPSLTITPPPAVTGTNVTINGHASDNLSGIVMVTASLNGATAMRLNVGPSGNFSFPTTLFLDGSNDGTNTVQFMAINGAGKITSQSVSFTLETKGPALTIASPANGTVSATNVTVTGTTSDAVSGIKSLMAQLVNSTGNVVQSTPVTVGNSGSFSYVTDLTTGGVDDGTYTVTLTATNGVGITTPKSVMFTLQSTAPTSGLSLALTAPVATAAVSTDGRLIGTVTETGTAVPSAEYSLDNSPSFTPLTLAASGGLDVPLSATALVLPPEILA